MQHPHGQVSLLHSLLLVLLLFGSVIAEQNKEYTFEVLYLFVSAVDDEVDVPVEAVTTALAVGDVWTVLVDINDPLPGLRLELCPSDSESKLRLCRRLTVKNSSAEGQLSFRSELGCEAGGSCAAVIQDFVSIPSVCYDCVRPKALLFSVCVGMSYYGAIFLLSG